MQPVFQPFGLWQRLGFWLGVVDEFEGICNVRPIMDETSNTLNKKFRVLCCWLNCCYRSQTLQNVMCGFLGLWITPGREQAGSYRWRIMANVHDNVQHPSSALLLLL